VVLNADGALVAALVLKVHVDAARAATPARADGFSAARLFDLKALVRKPARSLIGVVPHPKQAREGHVHGLAGAHLKTGFGFVFLALATDLLVRDRDHLLPPRSDA